MRKGGKVAGRPGPGGNGLWEAADLWEAAGLWKMDETRES